MLDEKEEDEEDISIGEQRVREGRRYEKREKRREEGRLTGYLTTKIVFVRAVNDLDKLH